MFPAPSRTPSTWTQRLTVAAIAVGAGTIAAGGSAFALPMAPGDNGDVKVHKTTTDPTNPVNEPKVCKFYLAAFDFDPLQEVTYTIATQPPNGSGPVLGGKITLVDGNGHTENLSLPDGQYKLVWTFEGASGAGKQKVFNVDCPDTGPGTTGGTTGGGTNGGNGTQPDGSVEAGGGGGISQSNTTEMTTGVVVAAAAAGGFGYYIVRRRRAADDGSS
ncbi:hypothetical protein [Embleya sp. NBC_00896]|uniref:hypothetical protein n=1 Tax=Embleya sp. NBC_00896 TaxID=2975961 RepID=UPI002F9114A8|nr:hypothetical protein OG928_38545 [Embleya sp. NBC_00896]